MVIRNEGELLTQHTKNQNRPDLWDQRSQKLIIIIIVFIVIIILIHSFSIKLALFV